MLRIFELPLPRLYQCSSIFYKFQSIYAKNILNLALVDKASVLYSLMNNASANCGTSQFTKKLREVTILGM